MAPVKVFGSAVSTNVARVLVCLEEVGVCYEVVDVNFAAGEHKGPENLARNVCGLPDVYFFFLGFPVLLGTTIRGELCIIPYLFYLGFRNTQFLP